MYCKGGAHSAVFKKTFGLSPIFINAYTIVIYGLYE